MSSKSQIGLVGLAVMGQNLALNIAEKGFNISVYNRSYDKTEHTVQRALDEKVTGRLTGHKELKDFVESIAQPRAIILLVQAGKPVDAVIDSLVPLLSAGDAIVDGGNEWFLNTERRQKALEEKGLLYLGMGVSGGEEGARNGPALMPGGSQQAFERISPIISKISAHVGVNQDEPCMAYIGKGGAGNYVKMIHNGIEYGDMQLIAEAYDILKHVGQLDNEELSAAFTQYNSTELESFLIEITSKILNKKDPEDASKYIVDTIKDKTGNKGTGKWTVQEAAERSVPSPTISTALDQRYISALLDQRLKAQHLLTGPSITGQSSVPKAELIQLVKDALYSAKILSYTQGMNLIKAAGDQNQWDLNMPEIAQIWRGGCIIRARFLNRITDAYRANPNLESLLFDKDFAEEINKRQSALRRVVVLSAEAGITSPGFAASLAYYDSFRRARLPANLTQAQRDFFGAHTYERIDKEGVFHTQWF